MCCFGQPPSGSRLAIRGRHLKRRLVSRPGMRSEVCQLPIDFDYLNSGSENYLVTGISLAGEIAYSALEGSFVAGLYLPPPPKGPRFGPGEFSKRIRRVFSFPPAGTKQGLIGFAGHADNGRFGGGGNECTG